MIDEIIKSTISYANHKKDNLKSTYQEFMKVKLQKEEMYAFLGVLLLLGLHKVPNHRYAWSPHKAQVLVRLNQLMTCYRFEVIGTFLHIVSLEDEVAGNRLRKILPLHTHIKNKCSELYQPLQCLSVDERMVRSKARTHFRQYMRNKPTKWGFKYWVLADITGYTVDFNLYEGKAAQSSGKGLGFDVVMNLVGPYAFQRYEVFFDNFYTSATILNELLQHEIVSTGTLRTDRVGVPKEVTVMKKITEKKNVPCGTGYYFRKEGDSITYCTWHDTKTVVLASTAYAGHSESTVKRRVKDPVTSEVSKKDVPCPVMLVKYNTYMGGVDKSD